VRKKKQLTWAEFGFINAGFRTTTQGLKFAMGWGLATAELGREPRSVEEYAEVMGESRATAFRNQQAFRKAFPGETSPARMNETSGAQAKYDDLWRAVQNRKRAAVEAQPIMFTVGGAAVSI